MPSPHPLNHAVLAQALHDYRNGLLRRCEAIGFSPRALQALKEPALVSILLNARVPWCDVKVNQERIDRLLNHGREAERESEQIERMLRLGASTDMMGTFHGLTHQEVALHRQMLGIAQRKGRWPLLTEEEDSKLWERWRAAVQERGIEFDDDLTMLELSMELAEEQSLPLAVIWSAIRDWIEQGLI